MFDILGPNNQHNKITRAGYVGILTSNTRCALSTHFSPMETELRCRARHSRRLILAHMGESGENFNQVLRESFPGVNFDLLVDDVTLHWLPQGTPFTILDMDDYELLVDLSKNQVIHA